MDWKSRVRSTFAASPRIPEDDVIEELAHHARAIYETARADGDSHDAADRRVADQLERWRLDASALRRASRRPPAIAPPPLAPGSRFTGLAQELRHACRMLARNPGFTAVAALSVALGIGANSALFSLHDAILLRPLPVPDPGAVVTVTVASPEDRLLFSGNVSYPNYRDLRSASQSFDGLIAYQLLTVSFARSRQTVREMRLGMLVSDNFFDVLGIQPALGRRFAPDEGRVPGRDAVVILGHDFWKNVLAGDHSILGGVVLINGIEFNAIGVAPESFTGLDPFVRPEFFVPAVMAERLNARTGNPLEDREARSFGVKGRLKAGVSQPAAETELTTLWKGLEQQYPDANRHRTIAVRGERQERTRLRPSITSLTAMMTALAALVLIIACANVANLMLGRARARSREMAIRLALGVSRMRLLRQLLTESLLLALLGGLLGVGFAYGGIRFFSYAVQTMVPSDLPVVIAPQMDSRVLIVSGLAAVVSAFLFGVAPAWQSLKTQLVPALKSSEPGETNRQRTIGRNVLVVAQIALSMVLLVAAGMLQAGFRNALDLNPGFRTDHLMMMSADTSFGRYTPIQTRDFYRHLVERARALPGVASVALSSAIPLDPNDGPGIVAVMPEGYQLPRGQENVSVRVAAVDERYFSTLRIAIVRGRAFDAGDSDSSRRVAIVNQEFAGLYWPNQDPIGKRIRLTDGQETWLEVVGVAETGKYSSINERPTPFFYRPFAQDVRSAMSLVIETTSADAAPLAAPLRDIVHAVDQNQPVFSLRTMSALYKQQAVAAPLLMMQTAGTMGALGLTLALIGLYGLVAYSVARRTREIGIRMAMGAARSDVLKMVLREGLTLSLAGILVGGVASVAVARLLAAGMAGLGAPNPAAYVVVPMLLIGLTLAASYFPARRASKVDPLRALRYE
jgi:putative ABC transport system permease protein